MVLRGTARPPFPPAGRNGRTGQGTRAREVTPDSSRGAGEVYAEAGRPLSSHPSVVHIHTRPSTTGTKAVSTAGHEVRLGR